MIAILTQMIKKFVGVYFLIGIILMPFIYSNNGGGHLFNGAYGFGQNLAKSLFWPSYVLAWEPEVDGDSDEKFTKSIVEMLKWRQSKWFAIDRAPYFEAVFYSIGACIVEEAASPIGGNARELYKMFFNKDYEKYAEMSKLRESIRDRFDGMDFKDVLDEGADCRKKMKLP